MSLALPMSVGMTGRLPRPPVFMCILGIRAAVLMPEQHTLTTAWRPQPTSHIFFFFFCGSQKAVSTSSYSGSVCMWGYCGKGFLPGKLGVLVLWSSWIIQIGPKYKNNGSYNKQNENDTEQKSMEWRNWSSIWEGPMSWVPPPETGARQLRL